MATDAHKLANALRALPDDIDMVEVNADDGASYFCCGRPVAFHIHPSRWPPGSIRGRAHAPDCWYTAARAALAEYDRRAQPPADD